MLTLQFGWAGLVEVKRIRLRDVAKMTIQRRRELAIRRAVGARPFDVVRLVTI